MQSNNTASAAPAPAPTSDPAPASVPIMVPNIVPTTTEPPAADLSMATATTVNGAIAASSTAAKYQETQMQKSEGWSPQAQERIQQVREGQTQRVGDNVKDTDSSIGDEIAVGAATTETAAAGSGSTGLISGAEEGNDTNNTSLDADSPRATKGANGANDAARTQGTQQQQVKRLPVAPEDPGELQPELASPGEESDGFATDMTSLADGEGSMVADCEGDREDDERHDGDEDGDEDLDDAVSIDYAASRYPIIPHQYAVDNPYDAATLNSSARSLYDDEVHYTLENGRRYCGSYYLPNDLTEQDRMRVMHQVYLNIFDLELTTVPLHEPTMILDIGTGTGEWPLGMADLFPDCEIVGTDISAIQPREVPYSVFFELDDAEAEWMRPPDSMDLVHLRNMAGAFSDWSFIYRQAHSCLKPGGYLEVLDLFHPSYTGPGNFFRGFKPESPFYPYMRDLQEADRRTGRSRGVDHLEPALFVDAGFTDVEVQEHIVLVDPNDETLGVLWQIACLFAFEAVGMRLLTGQMGWTAEQVREACDQIADEFKALAANPETNRDFKVAVKVVRAKKPLVPGQWTAQSINENGTVAMDYSGDDSTIGSLHT